MIGLGASRHLLRCAGTFKRLNAAKRGAPNHSNPLVHDHGDGHVHSHVPEGEISMASLVAVSSSAARTT